MAIAYDIDQANRIVHVLITSSISIADIEDTFTAIQADRQFTKSAAILIDAREMRRAFFVRESGNLVQVLASQASHIVGSYAFIVGQDFDPHAGRRFLIQARREGINLQLFRDHSAALKWLQLPQE
jgi:hypothetical protein